VKYFLQKSALAGVLVLLGVVSFAQPDEGWIKKRWHNMNARFNGLYHSRVLIQESITSLQKAHKDDFSKVVTVYGYGGPDLASQVQGNMEEVYKKCSELINKHPNSKWIDDAYFLIGKAYYFKNDPFNAIETFQYVSTQYPNSGNRFDSKLWIVLSFLRQDKLYDAESLLGLLKQEKDLPSRLNKDIAMAGAEIYIREGKYAQAETEVRKALDEKTTRNERYRLNFVLGQLLAMQEKYKESEPYFVKTIKLNPPYEFAFQSNLYLIRSIRSSTNGSLKTPKKYLTRMLRDDKNIDYFDQIYYELANLELQENNRANAIDYYQKSIASSTQNQEQKANSYYALANLFFEAKEYTQAQKYYDSTVLTIDKEHPNYEQIKATQSVLTDLIESLVEIERQDSLLDLGSKSRAEIDRLIDLKIQEEKRLAEEMAERKRRAAENEEFDANTLNRTNKVNANQNTGIWYFYNPSAVARGTNSFKRKWGDRPLVDNWRLTSKYNVPQKTDPDVEEEKTEEDLAAEYDETSDQEKQEILKDIDQNKRKYYAEIPMTTTSRAAAKVSIAKALFAAGKIYQNDLKEYQKAVPFYERLLEEFDFSSDLAEAHYNLFKCHEAMGNVALSNRYKKDLIDNYPNSPFTAVLTNRKMDNPTETSDKKIVALYEKCYAAFQAGQYEACLEYRKQALETSPGNALQAKFDLLAAFVAGKRDGQRAYLDALALIKENYPGTAEAQKAEDILAHFDTKKALAAQKGDTDASDYKVEDDAPHFYLVVYDAAKADLVEAAFSTYNKNNHALKNLRTNTYPLGDKQVMAVQFFENKDQAYAYYIEFLKNGTFFKEIGLSGHETFVITKNNFKTLMKDKNSNSYSVFFVQNYIQ
jgi:tetratricopeptide (TPR) repeat protein